MATAFPDSIVALSSGRLPAGIGIVRLSGGHTRFAVETIVGAIPQARTATFAHLRSPSGERIDSGVVLFFPGPASFTGEDVAEFQVHGGKAVVAALLETLTGLPGIRHAEPGEFTRRAFLNGKLDLLEAEGLADLISAETEAQRRLAVHNAEGVQSALYAGWRRRLIHARAMIEAELDFADESDVPGSVASTVWQDVGSLLHEVRHHVAGYRRAEVIRDGFDVVIVGAPNSGKSSLLNVLAARDAAIVSDEPGTTRDLVEVVLDIDGMKVRLTDTAGLRGDAGKVEAIGIERALRRAEKADLVLLLIEPGGTSVLPAGAGPASLLVLSKADLLTEANRAAVLPGQLLVSAQSGEGIPELLAMLGSKAAEASGAMGDVLPSRLRHVALLSETAGVLKQALRADAGIEMRADDLRLAADRLGRIAGAVDVEDLLDVIFSQFCIGK